MGVWGVGGERWVWCGCGVYLVGDVRGWVDSWGGGGLALGLRVEWGLVRLALRVWCFMECSVGELSGRVCGVGA